MKTTLLLLGLVSWCIVPLIANAQSMPEGHISANGSAEIKHAAQWLRVQVELTGKGKDMKEALAKLKERKELAMAHLATLGTTPADVTIADPSVVSERNDRQRQVEMMMMQRQGRAKKPDAKNKQPDPIVVSAMLKAEVPLKAATTEELLQLGHTIQGKIKSADLGGLKETQKLTPQDEELAEEMQEMNRMMAESGELRRGEPTFVYVYKITPAEHDKALKDAFAKANAKANRLASAAGVELGALHSLQENQTATSSDAMAEYYGRMGRMMREGDSDQADKDDKAEAVGANPVKVTLTVSVSVSFGVKAKK